jgi:hypothetical protein
MNNEESNMKTLTDRLYKVHENRLEAYGDTRFRLRFNVGPIRAFTQPLTKAQVVDFYVKEGDALAEAIYDMLPGDEDVELEYEYIPGNVWRVVGQTY